MTNNLIFTDQSRTEAVNAAVATAPRLLAGSRIPTETMLMVRAALRVRGTGYWITSRTVGTGWLHEILLDHTTEMIRDNIQAAAGTIQ